MPTHEPVVNTIIPKAPEKEIPVRVVSTRPPGPKVQQKPPVAENGNQTIPNETVQVADSTAAAESVKLSPQLSALARKEQAFRQRELALKQKEESQAEDLKLAQEFKELKAKLSAKDFSQAEQLGLNYDEYVKYKIDQANGEDPNLQKFKTLEDEIQKMKKTQEESDKQAFEETVSAYKKEIFTAVETDPKFLKVKRFEDQDSEGKTFTGMDVALNLILDAWEKDNEEMTVQQALVDTEMFITERAKKMAALIEEPKPAVEERRLPPPKPGVRTLTNQMQPTAVEAKPAVPLSKLPDAERYAEARRRALARRQQ